jgi:hypothetical protein
MSPFVSDPCAANSVEGGACPPVGAVGAQVDMGGVLGVSVVPPVVGGEKSSMVCGSTEHEGLVGGHLRGEAARSRVRGRAHQMWGEHDVCAFMSACSLLFLRRNKFVGDICNEFTHVLQPS